MPNWTPMAWPSDWRDPAQLDILKSTAVNYLLVDPGDERAALRTAAQQRGIATGDKSLLPPGIQIIKGDWPGIRMSPNGGDSASAGPTGEPWVDTNGWRIAVEHALSPTVASWWISAPPPNNAVLSPGAMRLAIADSAAAGGRWILALNDPLARGVAQGNAASIEAWKEAESTAAFFARQSEWTTWTPRATIGVVSDFVGKNSTLAREVVNLIGRAGSHYCAIAKNDSAMSFDGLRALLYADTEPPPAAVRKRILEFVNAGGTLVTTPDWGTPQDTPRPVTRPGYRSFTNGKGRIEMASEPIYDPYELANDAVIIVSHRHDLARLWNAGAHGSYCSVSPDGKRMLAQFLIYSGQPASEVTAWVAGQFRSAKLYTIEGSPRVAAIAQKAGGAEISLPTTRQYVAIELERM